MKQNSCLITYPLRVGVIRFPVFGKVIGEENQGRLMAALDPCRERTGVEDEIMRCKRLEDSGWTRNTINCGHPHWLPGTNCK